MHYVYILHFIHNDIGNTFLKTKRTIKVLQINFKFNTEIYKNIIIW